MDWMKMPPLAALRAFCAFAESRNLVQAGAALNVSHAAISQQLRALEKHLGVALLDRRGRALQLTAEGEELARALQSGFARIHQAVEDLTSAGQARPLHVTCTPTFAANWLMPRLAQFRDAHPDIDLVIDPTGGLVDPVPGGVDLALRFGQGQWPGLEAEMLVRSGLVVLAAPGLVPGDRAAAPEELLHYPWIEELGTTEATQWLALRGIGGARVRTRIALPGNLLLDGARDGQGIAVTVRVFAEPDLQAGRLVELFSDDSGKGYHIVTHPSPLRRPARAFIRWLKQQDPAPAAITKG
jgi:LysR family glycine cleavage system transcriptional activator